MELTEFESLKPGDLVEDSSGNQAKVVNVSDTTFNYEYHKPVVFIARWGMTLLGGIVYINGISTWKKLSNGQTK